MKLTILTILCLFVMNTKAQAKTNETSREPSQAQDFYGQVQLCAGTEALGNEGQGVGASALINVYSDPSNKGAMKCDLVTALVYEYGNDRGFKLGSMQAYNMTAVPTGKTDCTVKDENGVVLITLKKAVAPNSRSKRIPKVLVENCKMTKEGL